jgi:hypothetical protein
MRSAICLLFALLVPSGLPAQSAEVASLTGKWAGTGSFFDETLRAKVGPVAFAVEFAANGSATGRVGKATLRSARAEPARDVVEVRGKLDGVIGSDPALAKDHIVLIITKYDAAMIEGEFHLKSNSFFDPFMRDGRVTLRRAP